MSERDHVGPDPTEPDVWVGHHVVCFVDVLGQQVKLAEWAKLPAELQPTPAFVRALKETAGTVLVFREMFEGFFNEMTKSRLPAAWVESLSDRNRAIYSRYRDCRLNTQQFGDTFVFYSPIPNASGDVSMVAPFRMLIACCGAMIASLAGKVPVRGAVSVGVGLELAERTFYGPVLADAHCIESRVAGYPRIVVSPEAVGFFRGNAGFSVDPTVDAFMKGLADACRSLLCLDSDGQMIVDFMGQGIFDLQEGADPGTISAIKHAYRFARSEADRFRRAGDDKHAVRYAALQDYMEYRLPIWGLSHLIEGGKGAGDGE